MQKLVPNILHILEKKLYSTQFIWFPNHTTYLDQIKVKERGFAIQIDLYTGLIIHREKHNHSRNPRTYVYKRTMPESYVRTEQT